MTMTMINSIVRTSVSPLAVASGGTPTAKGTTPATDMAPSVIVRLSGADRPDAPATYDRPSTPVWQLQSTDAVTFRMARQYNAGTGTGRFSGLGAALVGQFASSGTGFAQSVSLHAGAGLASTAFSLKVATASGKTVTFDLMGSEGELAVRTTASDALDESERTAVSSLADGFQVAMDGLTGPRAKLDLSALISFDKEQLASVDFTATSSDGLSPMTVAIHADKTGRAAKVTTASGTIDIGISAPDAILGAAAQRAKAMAGYLDQVDKATARGHGDRELAAMFKSAFKELHAADDPPVATTRSMDPRAVRPEAVLLSGLADYHATFKQSGASSNPMRPGETDGFSFDTSQSTRMSPSYTRDREISQQRATHLLASFHSPLSGGPLALGNSPASQNYLYTQIDDRTLSQADIAYRNGILVKASLTQSATESTRQMKYVMGKLIDDTTTPVSHSSTRDLLGLLDSSSPRA